MLARLIVFLIRLKLGVKKLERFRFENQKSKNDFYYFSRDCLIKAKAVNYEYGVYHEFELSGVSLNWLLDKDCKITKVK